MSCLTWIVGCWMRRSACNGRPFYDGGICHARAESTQLFDRGWRAC